MPTLSEANRKIVGVYLRDVGDKLNLRDWTMTVMHASPQDSGLEEGYQAMVSNDFGSWEARFYFRPNIVDLKPEAVRETITHELLHVHRRALVHFDETTLKPQMSMEGWNLWLAGHQLLDEQAIEAVALAIAPLMPKFPGWAK